MLRISFTESASFAEENLEVDLLIAVDGKKKTWDDVGSVISRPLR